MQKEQHEGKSPDSDQVLTIRFFPGNKNPRA
jgi:hypothetical protein